MLPVVVCAAFVAGGPSPPAAGSAVTLCPCPAGIHHDRERAQPGPRGQQAAPGLRQPVGTEPLEES